MRKRFDPGRPEVPVKYGNSVSTDNHLYVDRDAVNMAACNRIPQLISSVFMKSGLSVDGFACVVINQCSKKVVDIICDKAGISEDKFYADMSRTGHTGPVSPPLALKEIVREKRAPDRTPVMLCGFAPGFSWGGAVLTF